jgi:hypothetical protein
MIVVDKPGRLRPRPAQSLPFVAFMETLQVDGLDLTRDRRPSRPENLLPSTERRRKLLLSPTKPKATTCIR